MFPNLTNLSLLLATLLLLLTLAKGEGKDFCCKEKMVGTTNYTLQPNNHHQLPLACLDNCVYTVANTSTPKYCFEKGDLPTKCLSDTTSGAPEATGSGGSATTESLESLNNAADQAKEDVEKATAEIAAADAAINAANDAASKLEQLDLTKFTSSGSRFKRQNDNNNNIVAPAGADVQIDQQSSSSSVTASSARDVPTTCTSLLKLMDEITETLTNNPAGVTPLITALSAIVTPLAEPCSADDITELTAKKNTAKTTADTAVAEQTKIKTAATEKYDTANEKLTSLNEQIAAQGGSAGSGAAGGKVCDFPKEVTGQKYTIPNIKTDGGYLELIFDNPTAAKLNLKNLKVVDHPEINFLCNDDSTICNGIILPEDDVPAGTYTIEVSSGDANAEGYTPWTTPPLLKTYLVNLKDQCTPATGAASGAPETSEVVSGAGSGGSATTQSLDSLSDAADQAKEEADKAADEIAAAEAAINAASDAANALDQLDLNKFTTSRSRFKRQNVNNIVTDANLNLVVESESESFTSSSDNAAGAGAQIVSNSVTESSSSANDVPTTCANLLKLMDEITETLTNNPAGVTPLMTALSAIVTPLAEPCSADDIAELTAKKNTAKTTADTAVAEQTKIKTAATETYDTANEKLTSLNEQIAARGGSAISGTPETP